MIGEKKPVSDPVQISDSALAEVYDRKRERCEETRIQNNIVISGVTASGNDQSSIESGRISLALYKFS